MGNTQRQAKCFHGKRNVLIDPAKIRRMGKIPQRKRPPIYLNEWIEATGRDIAGTAKAAGVEESYIRNLIAARKDNPSSHNMLLISEHLGVTVNDLYQPPPTGQALKALSSLSPQARAAIAHKLR